MLRHSVQIDIEFKESEEGADEPSPAMKMYREMEAFLLKHRKEWEAKNKHRLNARVRICDDRPRPNERGLDKGGPWTFDWDYYTIPEYKRPNPFELTNELGAFPYPSSIIDEKDDFDLAIDYGAARNRLRKNFEWDVDRLYLLEEMAIRKRKQEADARERADLEKNGKPDATTSDAAKGGAGSNDPAERTAPILKLNYAQWFKFRRLSNTEESESYLIDVLVGDPTVEDDLSSSKFAHRIRRFQRPGHSDLGQAMVLGQAPLPERIRIHSGVLKTILSSMFPTTPSSLVDLSTFVESISPVKDDTEPERDVHAGNTEQREGHVEQVEGKVHGASHAPETEGGLDRPQAPPAELDEDVPDGDEETQEEAHKTDDPDDPNQSQEALQHLRTLLEFMDSEMAAKREYLQKTECKKVFFADLWYLFRPGDEVIGRDGKQAYRVIHVRSLRHRKGQLWDAWRWYNSQDTEKKKKKPGPFSVTCVYIDFDGASIGPVSKTFDFKQFDGGMEMTSLPVYPLRLDPLKQTDVIDNDWRKLETLAPEKRYRQHLVKRGAKFLTVLGIKPMYYAGPTLGVRDDIGSRVVIDFETAFSAEDAKEKEWQPSLEMLIGNPVAEEEEEEEFNPI
ncbi:uncharacterized protein PG986_004268 [Apiospora aurea]|uniref:DUF7025 domain-containing protein n=1 Tax=Apiospora aurea TaxID=335848 RepID=A0ABR1QM37_9PEZI